MSEHENENETADDAEAIEAMNETPDDGEQEDDDPASQPGDGDGDGEPEEAQEPPAFEPPPGLTEKELEANYKKIERARTTFHNRISEIMGEDAQQLVACPACSHFVPGLIFPVEFDDVQKVALWHYMGLPDPNAIEQASDRHECAACKGKGQLRSGSQVPEYAIVNCRACQGKGYTDDVLPVAGTNGTNVTVTTGLHDQTPPMPEDPAWIEAARAAGYTIVPPMQPVNG
jgi:hypothetical protein